MLIPLTSKDLESMQVYLGNVGSVLSDSVLGQLREAEELDTALSSRLTNVGERANTALMGIADAPTDSNSYLFAEEDFATAIKLLMECMVVVRAMSVAMEVAKEKVNEVTDPGSDKRNSEGAKEAEGNARGPVEHGERIGRMGEGDRGSDQGDEVEIGLPEFPKT